MKPEDLTTWVLEEASPEERAAIESQIQSDSTLKSQADATRDFCSLLAEQLGNTEDSLTASQRSGLVSQAKVPNHRPAIPLSSGGTEPQARSTAQRSMCSPEGGQSESKGRGEEESSKGQTHSKPRSTPWWRRPGPATLAAAAVVTLMGGLSIMREGVLSDAAQGIESTRESAIEGQRSRSESALLFKDAPTEPSSSTETLALGQSLASKPEIVEFDGFINYGTPITEGDDASGRPLTRAPQLNVSELATLSGSTPGANPNADASPPMPTAPAQPNPGNSIEHFGLTLQEGASRSGYADLNEPVADRFFRVPMDEAAKSPQSGLRSDDSSITVIPVDATALRRETLVTTLPQKPGSNDGTIVESEVGADAPPSAGAPITLMIRSAGDEARDVGNKSDSLVTSTATDYVAFTKEQPAAGPQPMGGAGRELSEMKAVEDSIRLTVATGKAPQANEELVRKKIEQLAEREIRPQLAPANPHNESYTPIHENPFMDVGQAPLSTFSIDVDTASYANVRRFLNDSQRPPPDAVRIEELVNYFDYDYEQPLGDTPFSVHVDIANAPWNPTHRLARIGLKGREINDDRKPGNFVFLVDVSGSMNSQDKLPLVQKSLRLLAKQLSDNDRVAIVTYAGNSGLALESTPGADTPKILEAIDRMKSGGSTHGSAGIRLAYQQAVENFIEDGINRVILCTDGDFNVGISDPAELETVIAQKAKSGVFLSVLGFGTGNLKDRTMETLADKGNGNYAYIDSLGEARKVLVQQMNATLVTIAKDVKIQVEFNPAQIQSYRLIGYENRMLAKEDFNDDTKDAGEIGAGHVVTALYELVPVGVTLPDGRPVVDDLKYQAPVPAAKPAAEPASNETMTVKLRYKQPDGDKSQLLEVPVTDDEKTMAASPKDFQFASSVAGFGMLLRNSAHKGELTWDMVRKLALQGKGRDKLGYRGEFIQLVDKAQGVTER